MYQTICSVLTCMATYITRTAGLENEEKVQRKEMRKPLMDSAERDEVRTNRSSTMTSLVKKSAPKLQGICQSEGVHGKPSWSPGENHDSGKSNGPSLHIIVPMVALYWFENFLFTYYMPNRKGEVRTGLIENSSAEWQGMREPKGMGGRLDWHHILDSSRKSFRHCRTGKSQTLGGKDKEGNRRANLKYAP